jgi:hypothetical protein
MSDDEMKQFLGLLYRYIDTELDQFDNWRLDGPVYVSMSRALLRDWSEEWFDAVPRPGADDGQAASRRSGA